MPQNPVMMMRNIEEKVIVAGFGGQGVMLMGQILSYTATEEGLNTVWIPSYGPETRGGTANCSVIISSEMINSPVVPVPNTIIAMNKPSLEKFEPKLTPGGTALVNSDLIKDYTFRDDIIVYSVPCNAMALSLGNLKVANMIMLGAYLESTHLFEVQAIEKTFNKLFVGDKAKLITLNKNALSAGIEVVKKQRI